MIWQKMAQKWLEAADEVAVPALKRCYLERAATYERMATHPAAILPHGYPSKGDVS